MLSNKNLIKNIKTFSSKNFIQNINSLETNSNELKNIFDKFKREKYFGMYVPKKYGGIDLTHCEKIEIQEIMGGSTGTFSFLQAQTATPCWLFTHSKNESLKRHYLSSIANGTLSVGNATSHMKPKNKTVVTGIKEKAGYRVSGKIHFASGFDFFDSLTIGFNIEKGKEAFATIPFKIVVDKYLGEININTAIETVCMKSMNTVSLTLNNYLIADEEIIVIWPKQTFFEKYKEFFPYAYTAGIALEALRLAKKSILLKSNHALKNKLMLLQIKLNKFRKELRSPPKDKPPEILFADVINITWLCVQFSVLVSGGSGLLNCNNIQRLYREIIIWFIPRTYPSTIENWIDKLLK